MPINVGKILDKNRHK